MAATTASATKVLLTDLASSVNRVPSNYIRPISDRPNLSDVQSSDASIPLIDLQGLHGPNHSNIIKQIGQACQQDGFFQIKNHGIPETLISTIMNIAREFFRLPESERMKSYSDDPTNTTRLSTSFNVKTEKVSNWRDFLRLHCHPLEDYVNEWPSNPPSFREDVAGYCTSVRGLVPRWLKAISESLGLERDCIEKALGKQGQHIVEIVLAEIRANPTRTMGWFSTKFKEAWKDIFPLTERSVKEGWLPFSDPAWTEATNPSWSFLADLLPFDRAIHTNTIGYAGGLWILWNADRVDISLLSSTEQEIHKVLSNDQYKSVLHQAVVNCNKERISIPTFYCPSNDALIGPAKDLIDNDHPAIYRNFTYAKYYEKFWNRGLATECCLDMFKTSSA